MERTTTKDVHQPKSVVITGGCGFIASNFINQIAQRWPYANIINFDKLDPGSNACNVKLSIRASARYCLITGDIGNYKLFLKTLQDHQVDTVINFAANSHVDACYKDPIDTTRNNVMGMLKMMEAVRDYGKLTKFVQISTDEVYGDSMMGENVKAKTEEDASKASCEALLNSYLSSYKIPAVILRMNNVYGPRQWETKVVPCFIRKAEKNLPLPIMGDGLNLRSWMHTDDACNGIAKIAEAGRVGQIYNLGTHTEIKILDLARMIHDEVDRTLGRSTEFRLEYVEDRPYNDRRYFIDFTKVNKELGWSCKIDFKEGLRGTVEWYLNPEKDTMTEHVMVFGGNGWIGQRYMKHLHDINVSHSLAFTRPGIHKDEEVEAEMIKIFPTHVICLIGRTHGPGKNSIEYLEGGPDKLEENIRDNMFGPWLLATICEKLGIHFTYIGTGCLFQYDEAHPMDSGVGYTEEDVCNYSGNSYGVAKGFTDRMMMHFPSALNVRIRLPVSHDLDPRNLVVKVASFKRVFDIPDNVSVLPELMPVLVDLMRKRFTGTMNLVNPGTITLSQILNIYKNMIDPTKEWESITPETEEAKAMLSKRSHCDLDTSLLTSMYPDVKPVKEAMLAAVQEVAARMGKKVPSNNKTDTARG